MGFYRQLLKGLWEEIPVFRVVLGMCPVLAVTTSVENGIGMGLAATFVLICSNVAVSALRNVIPNKVRIPCFIVVAATFVTIVDLCMKAYTPALSKSLGIFIPLIVVNCIILGRAEAYAARNNPWMSLADGIGMGLGFTLALIVVAAIREVLGNGSITIWAGKGLVFSGIDPILVMVLAPGGFITLGCILAGMNRIQMAISAGQGKGYTPSAELDCRHCVVCKFGE